MAQRTRTDYGHTTLYILYRISGRLYRRVLLPKDISAGQESTLLRTKYLNEIRKQYMWPRQSSPSEDYG